MLTISRVILLVLDSVGVGELPDARKYGDQGSNTLQNTARVVSGLKMPHMQKLGLGNIIPVEGVPAAPQPQAAFGKMAEKSPGKDTTTGHWEIAGLILKRPFPVYPEGFPDEIITEFSRRIGRQVLGNKPASGTEIIKELGEKHIHTGYPIVYTSADSVFQVAAHEEVIPVDELYRICQVARELLVGRHGVGRVIARPFTGKPGAFQRTERRRDFSLPPTGTTILDVLAERRIKVVAVGKIWDIFAGRGISHAKKTKGNKACIAATLEAMQEYQHGLIFTNLVDFDQAYGHRNDPAGYAEALEEFDRSLPDILKLLNPRDLLIITADHGCDPTTPSTDHSREYVPLLVTGKQVRYGVNLGIRNTFADIAATIAGIFEVPWFTGRSFLKDILVEKCGD
ncbi:MAG: phosphopentomutase [Peptococcaceae bacterium]|nr:phosphopentomutase [Peptococcaceae bacterium]